MSTLRVDNLQTTDGLVTASVADLAGVAGKLSTPTGATLVGYNTNLTVAQKLSQSVSVDDYIATGVTDHTTAIQSAVNSGARSINFSPNRVYTVSNVINLASNQVIFGNGAQINVVANSNFNAVFYGVDVSNVTIKDIYLNCNSRTLSGFRIYSNTVGCSRITFSGVRVVATANDPTLQYGGIEVAALGGLAGSRNSNIKVINSEFGPVGTHGVLIAYSDEVVFTGNRVVSATNHGMEAVGCTQVTIADNTVTNCLISGLGVGANTRNFSINNNRISNCAGDGSITVEHNSVMGNVSGNTLYNCNTSGINVSFGTPTAAPHDKVRDVIVVGNVIHAKAGVTTYIGVNYYSSTGVGLGRGVIVSDNIIEGFNVGVAYAYSEGGQVSGNSVLTLTGTGSVAIRATYLTRTSIVNNTCLADTGAASIQLLDYSGLTSSRVTIKNNTVLSSNGAAAALIYIEGTGSHQVTGNVTSGSSNFVSGSASVTIVASDNTGELTGVPYSGITVQNWMAAPVSTTVGTTGAATALPTQPLGYLTLFNASTGAVKVPYYRV